MRAGLSAVGREKGKITNRKAFEMAWNGSGGEVNTSNPPLIGRGGSRRGAFVGLGAVAALILLGWGIWWSLRSEPAVKVSNERAGGPAPLREQSPAPTASAPSADVESAAPEPKPVRLWNGIAVVSSSVHTNRNGTTVERLVLADGRRAESVRPASPVFANASDQLIATVLAVRPGQSMPPLPDLSGIERDFRASMENPVPILDSDTPEVRELKAQVAEVRAYLAEEVRRGASVMEALTAHREEMERMADHRLMAIREIEKIAAEDGEEAARQFASRVNESLRERGIPEVSVGDAASGKVKRH